MTDHPQPSDESKREALRKVGLAPRSCSMDATCWMPGWPAYELAVQLDRARAAEEKCLVYEEWYAEQVNLNETLTARLAKYEPPVDPRREALRDAMFVAVGQLLLDKEVDCLLAAGVTVKEKPHKYGKVVNHD